MSIRIFCVVAHFTGESTPPAGVFHHIFTRCKTEELYPLLEVLQASPSVGHVLVFHTDKMDSLNVRHRLNRADLGLDNAGYLEKIKDHP